MPSSMLNSHRLTSTFVFILLSLSLTCSFVGCAPNGDENNKVSSKKPVPIIVRITEAQIKKVGDAVQMDCALQNVEEYPVWWIKSEEYNQPRIAFMPGGRYNVVGSSRFTANFDNSTSIFTLQGKQLVESDSGTYTCQIIGADGYNNNHTAAVKLQVTA